MPIALDFGKQASVYEQTAHVQAEMAEWLSEWLPQQTADSVIEVAAGTGFLTRKLTLRFGSVLATDVARGMIECGQTRVRDAQWEVMDALKPSRECCAGRQWMVSGSFLQWLPSPQETISLWKDLLPTGARQLHGFYTAPCLEALAPLSGLLPLSWKPAEYWKNAFIASGYTRVSLESKTVLYPFESGASLLHWLKGIGAVSSHRRRFPAGLLSWMRETGQSPVAADWTFTRLLADE